MNLRHQLSYLGLNQVPWDIASYQVSIAYHSFSLWEEEERKS